MPSKHYEWRGGNIPLIGEHSLAKHRILRRYVETYIEVLTSNPRRERLSLALVDGFAGGGVYRLAGQETDRHPGSPIILMQAVASAAEKVNKNRKKNLDIVPRYYFIEQDAETVATLRGVVSDYRQHVSASEPTILTGTFDDHLDEVIRDIKKRRGRKHRAIFLLDQYGYSAVPFATTKKIFDELPHAEIFLTLAVGWIASYLKAASQAQEWLCERLDIDVHADAAEIEERLAGENLSAQRLRVVQKLLHDAYATQAGARHFTPFFIMSRLSNRPYWFLHLANSLKANDVVKDLHWRTQNHFIHYGDTGLSMLAYDPRRDIELTGQLAFEFDDDARQRAKNALLAELPRRLREHHPDGISFDALCQELANETPVTQDMLNDYLTSLCIDGEVDKRGALGERRHTQTRIHGDDILFPASQERFSFFPRGHHDS